jgi:transposase InsO family protein
MQQSYHRNAKTNSHLRKSIQESGLSNNILADTYRVSQQTISKWRNRTTTEDKSSRPATIHYALNPLEKEIIRVVRTMTWMALDDLVDTIQSVIPHAKRSTISRTLQFFDISRVPQAKRAEANKFKEYEPGFLHMDVTYLPKIEGKKYYLFVAIDRATRLMYYKVYQSKSADSTNDFLAECMTFFPFTISHILTDNGLEFTNRFSRGAKEPTGNHRFDKACAMHNIKHRLTEPFTPKTNGMVERANGIIKAGTIKVEKYNNLEEMVTDLDRFLLYYLFARRHGSLKRELNVRTPYEALQNWYNLDSTIFTKHPEKFRTDAILWLQQRGGT